MIPNLGIRTEVGQVGEGAWCRKGIPEAGAQAPESPPGLMLLSAEGCFMDLSLSLFLMK